MDHWIWSTTETTRGHSGQHYNRDQKEPVQTRQDNNKEQMLLPHTDHHKSVEAVSLMVEGRFPKIYIAGSVENRVILLTNVEPKLM